MAVASSPEEPLEQQLAAALVLADDTSEESARDESTLAPAGAHTALTIADEQTIGPEANHRCPTQVARSRNWLTTSLDDSVRSDALALDRELEDALSSLKRWREDQTRQFEASRSAALCELQHQRPAGVEEQTTSAAARGVPRSRTRPEGVDAYADENAREPRQRQHLTPHRGSAEWQGERPTAAERVALAEQSFLDNESEASIAETHVLNARMTSEMEKLVQAEAEMAEMDRMSSELVAYSSGLHDLLAKMHALER